MIANTNSSNQIAITMRQNRSIWLLAIVLTILSIVVHITSPSTIHFSDTQWEEIIEHHRTNEIFKARPLTTGIITYLAEHTELDWRLSFFSLQFLLFLLTGPAFYYYLRSLTFTPSHSKIGMVIYMLSLPMFLAHFEPIFTWDDFWVYLFVPLSLAFAIRQKYVPSIISMTIALVARETTLLFLPSLAFICSDNMKKHWAKAALVPASAALIYMAIKIALVGTNSAEPLFSLSFNFDGWIRSRDSIFSILVSLGFLWVVGIKELSAPSNRDMRWFKVIKYGALLTIAGFLSSSLLYGHIRESRLLMPIALFLIPLVLMYFQEHAVVLKKSLTKYLHTRWKSICSWIVLFAVSIGMSKLIFPSFEYRRWQDGNWIWMGLHIGIILVFLITELMIKHDSSE